MVISQAKYKNASRKGGSLEGLGKFTYRLLKERAVA
jgi:hypothetical protein